MTTDRKAPPFWLVWNPNGHSPTFRHATLRSAEVEAHRLAALAPGQTFFVLQPTGCAVMLAVTFTRYADSEIPF